jgi:hypothetical protein
MATRVKKVMLGVKVAPEVKAQLQTDADAAGIDLSDHVRAILDVGLGKDRTRQIIRGALAEAMVAILACQGRSVSTEQAIEMTKELFVKGAFAEDFR